MTMRVAFSGAGLRSGNVLSILKAQMPEAEFVGYFDPQPTFLGMIGEDIPAFDSVEKLLDGTKPDLFFVGSPNEFHLDHIEHGLKAGIQVFAEKPVVMTMDQTWKMAELLAEYGSSRVMVGLVLRYSRHMIDLRQALADGLIGPIASIEANELIGTYHGAFFMRDWRRHSRHSGGFMLEKCCHDLDIYNMITASRPVRVASFGGRRSFLPEYAPADAKYDDVYRVKQSVWLETDNPFTSDGDIIDSQTALLEYENGPSMAFHTNLNTPDEQRRFCVLGARGMAEGDFHRGYLRVTRAGSNNRVIDKEYSESTGTIQGHYGADELMVGDVIKYLRNETESLPVSVVDALQAGIAALSIDEARRTQKIVDLTETWKRFDAYNLRAT